MTDTDAVLAVTDAAGTPFADYLQVVEFRDDTTVDIPVHASTRGVWFDGEPGPGFCHDVSVEGGGKETTVITMRIPASDVVEGRPHDHPDGFAPYLICGRHVMTPANPGWRWERNDEEDWAIVSFFARQILFR